MIKLKISLSSKELINRSRVIEEIQNEIDNIIRSTRRTYELLDSISEVPTTRARRILSDAIQNGNKASSNAASIIEGFRRGAGLIDARDQEIASRINLKKSLYPSLEGIGKSPGYASAIGTCSQSSKARVNTRLKGLYGISEASSIDVGIAVNRTITSVKNEVAEATYRAKNKLEETLTNWRETVDVIGKAVGDVKIKASSKIKSSIEYAAVKTQDAVESIGDAVKRKISEVLGRIKALFQTLFKIANGIIDNIVKYGKMAIDVAVPIIIDVIKNEVSRRINIVKGVFNYIWDGIKYALLGNWGGEGNLLGIVLRMALEALCWISLVTPFAPIGIIGLALFTIQDLSYDIVHFEGKPMDYVSIGLDLLGALPLIGVGLKKTKYGAKFLRYLKGPIDDIMSTKTVKWINKVADNLKGRVLNSKILSRVGKTLDAIKLRILNTKLVKKVVRFRDAVVNVIGNDIDIYRRAGITPQKPEGTFVGRVKKEFDELGKEIDGKDIKKIVEGIGETKTKYAYNMIENPGPLAELKGNPASNFLSGKYNIKVLEEDTILYRSGKKGGLTIAGQEKNALGQWFTREPAESVAKVRIDSAVKAQWIDPKTGVLTGTSPIESTYAIKIPKGTTIYEGPVGYQGSSYLGGESCNQIFISEPWKIIDLEVLKEFKIQ